MTIFSLILGGLAVWGIAASIVVVARDGYRRQPTRPQVDARPWASGPSAGGPADLSSGQWLRTSASAGTSAPRPRHAAGVMVMRPW